MFGIHLRLRKPASLIVSEIPPLVRDRSDHDEPDLEWLTSSFRTQLGAGDTEQQARASIAMISSRTRINSLQ